MARDALSPDDEQLLPLAVAIADGTAVDWPAASTAVLQRLQCLERLVRGHEAVRSLPARAGGAARETLLTEARRKAALSDHPLRVQWGPLIVHEKIGRGSFGDVYRAWDPRLDREVALKLIPENVSATASSPAVEEGRLLARVHHPNVMVVYGAERIDGRIGIWTEYIRGETLASEVARRGPLSSDETARIGADVCAALAAVHAAGLLHRDVKAQNILRDAKDRIVLGDFGTGVEFADDARVADPQIAGTPLYLAPEVLDGKPATIASDLYGTGVLLYFLLTGDYPVRGRTLSEIKHAHARSERVPLRTGAPDLAGALVRIVETLLADDPGARYSSAGEVEAELRAGLLPSPNVTRRSSRRVVAGVMAAILMAATVAGVVWRDRWWAWIAQVPETAAPLAKAGDWIVVAELDNRTGEPVIDGTLRAAVERELEYSGFIRVAQRDRIEDALKLLQRPLDSRLNKDLALELSQRDGGVRAVVTGTIAKTADGYELTFEVVNPANRVAAATMTERVTDHPSILPAVRRQTLRIRQAFGEPAGSIERSREAFQRAALPSLKALSLMSQVRAIVDARRPSLVSEWASVESIAREMTQEDTAFPLGHLALAWSLSSQGRKDDALSHAERALRLADNATPQERYFIISTLHGFKGWGPGGPPTVANRQELEQAAAALEALLALQPDHYYVNNNLGWVYRGLGRERDAAWMNLRIADARPWSVRVNHDAANQLLREGNVDGARRYGARAESALSPGSSAAEPDLAASVRLFNASVAWLHDDPNETLRSLNQVAGSAPELAAGERRPLYSRLWALYAAIGRLDDAAKVIETMRSTDVDDFANTMRADMAQAELFEDRRDRIRLREFAATVWRDSLPDTAPPFMARRVTYLIEAGLLDAAQRDLQWFSRRTAQASAFAPRTPATQFVPFLASSAAAIDLARGRTAAAVTTLREAMPAIRSAGPVVFSAGGSQGQYAAMKLAQGLETLGNLPEAIRTLEDATRDRVGVTIGNSVNRWVRTSAQLARLYRKNGQEPKAQTIETQLLKLLAAADQDHPLVMELRRR